MLISIWNSQREHASYEFLWTSSPLRPQRDHSFLISAACRISSTSSHAVVTPSQDSMIFAQVCSFQITSAVCSSGSKMFSTSTHSALKMSAKMILKSCRTKSGIFAVRCSNC